MSDDGLWAKGYAAAKESLRGELEWQRAEIERLTGEISTTMTMRLTAEIERLRAWAKDEQQKREKVEEDRLRERQENERLRAALLAQEEADAANEGRVGYDKWQALEDKAKELRLAALGHQQSGDGK